MSNEIVFKVLIHCEGCKDKVSKCLRSFDGVCEVEIDDDHIVTVRGKNLDSLKIFERLKKKYSRNVELISTEPNIENEEAAEPDGDKKEQIELKIVVLEVKMHCEACATEIQKYLQRMTGVMTVEPNLEDSTVTVKGNVDPEILVEYIKKGLGKNAGILSQEILICDSRTSCCACEAEEETTMLLKDFVDLHDPEFHWSRRCACVTHMFSDENTQSCSLM